MGALIRAETGATIGEGCGPMTRSSTLGGTYGRALALTGVDSGAGLLTLELDAASGTRDAGFEPNEAARPDPAGNG